MNSPSATSGPEIANIVTNHGNLNVKLEWGGAPNTVRHFVNLASAGFYSGAKFYRVVSGEYMQAGIGYAAAMSLPRIASEADPHRAHIRGVVGFAWQDLADRHSGATEIYVLFARQEFMDEWGFTRFGLIYADSPALDSIAAVKVHTKFLYWDGKELTTEKASDSLEVPWHQPIHDVIINSIELR